MIFAQCYMNRFIYLVGRVFANGPGDLDSILGRVIRKTLKMVLDTSLLNTQQYKVRIKGQGSNLGKEVVPSPTPRCSSYWRGNLLVTFDYGCQLYLLYMILNVPTCSPGGNTPQGTNYTAICLPSRKLYKLDKPDMQDTTGEAGTSS